MKTATKKEQKYAKRIKEKNEKQKKILKEKYLKTFIHINLDLNFLSHSHFVFPISPI